MRTKFTLEPYFNTYKYMVPFYDALIKKSTKLTKRDFLLSLGISPATYNRANTHDTAATKKIFDKLERSFNINPLNSARLQFYDEVLADLIIKIYYKHTDILNLESRIQSCIMDNNYLAPIFELLLYLMRLQNTDLLEILKDDYIEAYNSLKCYEGLFKAYPVFELYEYLFISTGNPKILSIASDIPISTDFRGMIYNAIAVNAYHNNRYDLSLYYSNKAISELIKMCNYRRIIILNLTFFATLNAMGEYKATIYEATHQLMYLYDTKSFDKVLMITKLHLYNAYIGENQFDDIISLANSYSSKAITDYVYLLIASRALGLDSYNTYKMEALELNEKRIYDIISILEEDNINIKKDKIKDSGLNKTLVKLLLSHYNI